MPLGLRTAPKQGAVQGLSGQSASQRHPPFYSAAGRTVSPDSETFLTWLFGALPQRAIRDASTTGAHGAAAPNPAELSQLDRFLPTPKSPQGDFSPPVPQGSVATSDPEDLARRDQFSIPVFQPPPDSRAREEQSVESDPRGHHRAPFRPPSLKGSLTATNPTHNHETRVHIRLPRMRIILLRLVRRRQAPVSGLLPDFTRLECLRPGPLRIVANSRRVPPVCHAGSILPFPYRARPRGHAGRRIRLLAVF